MKRGGSVSISSDARPPRIRAFTGPPSVIEDEPPYPSVRTLRSLHVAAASMHAAWVALGLACLTSTVVSAPVWFERITYAEGSDPGFIQRGPRETVFKFYNFRVLLGFVGITSLFHILYATLDGAGAYGNRWRWLEYRQARVLIS